MRIGLYFGSFNPVHHGHLIIANHVLQHSTLEQVWFMVSPQNPFKQSSGLLNEYHRLHLIQTAIEGEKNLRVSDIEFHLPKPSYTVTTLAYLEEKYPQHSFALIMGSDSYQNLPKWKNAEVLLSRYPIYVYLRPEFPIDPIANSELITLEAPLLQISATHIRELVKEGKSIRYLVPDKVMEEILRNGYYK